MEVVSLQTDRGWTRGHRHVQQPAVAHRPACRVWLPIGLFDGSGNTNLPSKKGVHTMKKFMILTVVSVAISLQAGAVEPNGVNRYSSRAALLPARVTTQTHPPATVAAGDLSGRFSFLVPRPGLIVVNALPLNSDRYNTKAGFRRATRVEIETVPLK